MFIFFPLSANIITTIKPTRVRRDSGGMNLVGLFLFLGRRRARKRGTLVAAVAGMHANAAAGNGAAAAAAGVAAPNEVISPLAAVLALKPGDKLAGGVFEVGRCKLDPIT